MARRTEGAAEAVSLLSPYLLYIKIGAAAALLAIVAGGSYHFGGMASRTQLEADRAEQSGLTATAVLAERASAAATATQDHATEATHAQVIVSIDSAPPISAPVLLCGPSTLRVGTVPGAEGETGGVPASPDEGRGQPVDRGRDIRPALEAVKKRLEKVMADYRQEDTEWPKK
jgi:hypothetical protein